jgi:hypothetical protein
VVLENIGCGKWAEEATATLPTETADELAAAYAMTAAPCSSNNAASPAGAAIQLGQDKQQCSVARRSNNTYSFISKSSNAAPAAQSAAAPDAQLIAFVYKAYCTY